MKKLLFLALLLMVSIFALAACGNGDPADDPIDDPVEQVEATPAPEVEEPDDDENGPEDPPEEVTTSGRDELLAGFADWPAPEGYVVLAHWTTLDSNIHGGWTNPMPIAQARILMFNGMSTMGRNSDNEFFPNPMVSVDAQWPEIRDNADGTRTYTFTIYTDNRFSDGSPILAKHYAASLALFTSPHWAELVPAAGDYLWVEGRPEWIAGETDTLVGVRIYNDSQFSVTAATRDLPNVWASAIHMNIEPTPIHMYGAEAHDNGSGVFLTALGGGELTFEALQSVVEGGFSHYLLDADGEYVYVGEGDDAVRVEIADGVRYRPTVFAGPYMFENIDVGNGVLTLVANPYFPGTWDGYRPRIERVIWRITPQPLLVDSLLMGDAHMMVTIDDGDALTNAMEVLVGGGTHTFVNYDQFGQVFAQFHTDTGPAQFRAVRQAISFMIDRHEIAERVGRGFATVAHGPWGPAWWWYQEAANRDLYDRVTIYDLDMARAIALLEEDGWVYDANGDPWTGEGLRHRWVDEWHWGTDRIPEMEEVYMEVPVLDEDGEETGEYEYAYVEVPTGEYLEVVERMVWEYNEEGMRVRPIRSNKVYTGEQVLMPLIINWMVRDVDYAPRDFLELQLFDNLAAAGGQLVQERSSLWGTYLQMGYRREDRYEFHVLGVGMGNPWTPWNLMSLEWIPMSNWGQVDCERTRELSDAFRVMDISTEEGLDAFVEGFIEYMAHLTYEAFTIPFHMSLIHDFIPPNLGNYYSNPLWAFPEAIQRAYWID